MLKYFNDFLNQNFPVLWLKWIQTMEIKQNQTLFHRTYSNLTSFFTDGKLLKYFSDFHNWHLSVPSQKWAQSKTKIKQDMCKSDSISSYLQTSTLLKRLILKTKIYFLIRFISKNKWQQLRGKKSPSFNFIP